MAPPPLRTTQQKLKSGIWAAAVAAVIVVGTITGAQLKSDKQKEEAIKEFRTVQAADQIALLEARRLQLVDQRAAMQRKLDVFREGLREKQMEQERAKNK